MNQTITVTKSYLDEIIERLNRLERIVFKKDRVLRSVKQYEEEKQKEMLSKLDHPRDLFS